jgi:hypothetical protein
MKERYACLRFAEWHHMVIGIGAGSCWGEFPIPLALIERTKEGVRTAVYESLSKIGRTTRLLDDIEGFQQFLYDFAIHIEEHGSRPANAWHVYSIKMYQANQQEPFCTFSGASSTEDRKAQEFENRIEQLLGQTWEETVQEIVEKQAGKE